MTKRSNRSNPRVSSRSIRARGKRRAIVLDAIDELHVIEESLRCSQTLERFANLVWEHAAIPSRKKQASLISRPRGISPIPTEAADLGDANSALVVVAAWRLERLALVLSKLIED